MTVPQDVDLGQVFGFLSLPALQATALEVLLGLSTAGKFIEILRQDPRHVHTIVSLSKREAALKILVNASRDLGVAATIWQRVHDQNMVGSLLDTSLGRMLFCNLSKVTECRDHLIESYLTDLVDKLLVAADADDADDDDVQYLRYILVELSATTRVNVFDAVYNVRSMVVDDFVASITKNVLFNVDNHPHILQSFHPFNHLATIDNPSPTIVEMMLLMCTTFPGRQALRQSNVYVKLKEAHMQSTDDEYRELVERVVELLIRDDECENVSE